MRKTIITKGELSDAALDQASGGIYEYNLQVQWKQSGNVFHHSQAYSLVTDNYNESYSFQRTWSALPYAPVPYTLPVLPAAPVAAPEGPI